VCLLCPLLIPWLITIQDVPTHRQWYSSLHATRENAEKKKKKKDNFFTKTMVYKFYMAPIIKFYTAPIVKYSSYSVTADNFK